MSDMYFNRRVLKSLSEIHDILDHEFPGSAPAKNPIKHYVADNNAVLRGNIHRRDAPLDQIKDWYIEVTGFDHAKLATLKFEGEEIDLAKPKEGKVALFGSALQTYRKRILKAAKISEQKHLRGLVEKIYSAPYLSFEFSIEYPDSSHDRYTSYDLWFGDQRYLSRKMHTGNWSKFDSFQHRIYRNWQTDNLQLLNWLDSEDVLFPD